MELKKNEVHLWQGDLEGLTQRYPDLPVSLSPDETLRAQRLYFEKDRTHFIAARGLLRTLLGYYLNTAPSGIRFQYNPYGKPLLEGPLSSVGLNFNLSHSHGKVLLAFARGLKVGVDLESLRSHVSFDQIATRYFSAEEALAVVEATGEEKPRLFFRSWTFKEAYIKALGQGLSFPLNQIRLQWQEGQESALVQETSDPKHPSQWSLLQLKTAPQFFAALAAENISPLLRHHSLEKIGDLLKLL